MLEPVVALPCSSYLAPFACANLLKGLECADTLSWLVVCHPVAPPSLDNAAARPPPPPPPLSFMLASRLRAASARGSGSDLSLDQIEMRLFAEDDADADAVGVVGRGGTAVDLNFLPRTVLLPLSTFSSSLVLASSLLAAAMRSWSAEGIFWWCWGGVVCEGG